LLQKAGNSGDISYLLSWLRMIHDVILTSLSVYLLTVPVNLVYVKLCGLAMKIRFWSKTCMIQHGIHCAIF